MATNLRLRPDAQDAVRAEAARTGRSQQDLIRTAVDEYLHLAPTEVGHTDVEVLMGTGQVLPPRSVFRQADELIALPRAVSSLDLLDRDDRV
jgi:hypothetical protein